MKTKLILVLVVLTISTMACLCGDSSTVTPTPAVSTSTAVPTAKPTMAPTAVPTATTQITPTATANSISDTEVAYALEITAIMFDYTGHFNTISELAEEENVDNQDWIVAMMGELYALQDCHQRIVNLSVPPRYEEHYKLMLDGSQDIYDGAEILLDWLYTGDNSRLGEAFELIANANQKWESATGILDK